MKRRQYYVNKTDYENTCFAEFPIFCSRKLCKTRYALLSGEWFCVPPSGIIRQV